MNNTLDFKYKFLEKEKDKIYNEYNSAKIAYKEKNMDKAKKILDGIYTNRALYIDDQSLVARVLILLGEVYYSLNDKEKAKEFSSKALTIVLCENLKYKDIETCQYVLNKYILVNEDKKTKNILHLLEDIS